MWKTGVISQGNAIQAEPSVRSSGACRVWYWQGTINMIKAFAKNRNGGTELRMPSYQLPFTYSKNV